MNRIMEGLKRWLHRNGLFIKVFGVSLLSVILVAVLISISTLRVSMNYFMETFSLTNERITNESKGRFESYSYSVFSTLFEIENNGIVKGVMTGSREPDERDQLTPQTFYNVTRELQQIYRRLQAEGANMIVTDGDQQIYNMNYSYWPTSVESLMALELTAALNENKGQTKYMTVARDDGAEPLIVAGKSLVERTSDHIYGYIFVSLTESQMRRFFDGYTSEENMMMLVDQSGYILSSDQTDLIDTTAPGLVDRLTNYTDEDTREVMINNENYLSFVEYIPGFDMYLVNLVNQQAIFSRLLNTRDLMFIITTIILLATGLSYLISHRITRSLTHLVRQIAKLNRHNFSKRLNEVGDYETLQIARAFNYALDELDQYVNVVVQSQKKEREAELRALQHQINPHFLYNTLTTVKFMVGKGDNEKATGTIHALIRLLQHTLGDINETVTVKDELDHTKDYVSINQARYGKRIRVHYFVAPDCYDYTVPKLVLQPFIENSFFHGFNEKKTGFIQIMVNKTEDTLHLEVSDDGDGFNMSKERFPYVLSDKKTSLSGIGMRNVHERITLLYGNDYGVRVSSERGVGTQVKISLPLVTHPKEVIEDHHTT